MALARLLLVAGMVTIESSIIAKARGSVKIFNDHCGVAANQLEWTVLLQHLEAEQVEVSPGQS